MPNRTYILCTPVKHYSELQVRSSFNKSPADPLSTIPFELMFQVRRWRVRREGDETILFTGVDDAQ